LKRNSPLGLDFRMRNDKNGNYTQNELNTAKFLTELKNANKHHGENDTENTPHHTLKIQATTAHIIYG